jgi:hypothetical protein
MVGVRRGSDRRLGTRLPQELAPDLTRRPEPPQARTGPRPPSALYLLSLPPPLGVVGRCRSIRWALRRGGILECGNGSIRFIYSWGSLRKFFWGGFSTPDRRGAWRVVLRWRRFVRAMV